VTNSHRLKRTPLRTADKRCGKNRQTRATTRKTEFEQVRKQPSRKDTMKTDSQCRRSSPNSATKLLPLWPQSSPEARLQSQTAPQVRLANFRNSHSENMTPMTNPNVSQVLHNGMTSTVVSERRGGSNFASVSRASSSSQLRPPVSAAMLSWSERLRVALRRSTERSET